MDTQRIRRRFTSLHAWELPKQTGALAPEYAWTNKDMGKEHFIFHFLNPIPIINGKEKNRN